MCDLCHEEIEAEAKRFSRGLSKTDEISAENEVGEEISQGLSNTYAYEEFYQIGRRAVRGRLDSYEPSKGTVQGFVRKRIYYAMVDLLREKQDPDPPDLSFGKAMEEYLASVERGERDSSVFIEEVADCLDAITVEEWHGIVRTMTFELVRFLWGLLHQFREELAPKIGASKHAKMSAAVTWRYFYLRLDQAAQKGANFVEVSGPQHMEIVERIRKVAGELPARVDDRAWGRKLDKDGKTVARWRERIAEAGAPPLIEEDGSFSLENQDDHDAWAEYWMRVIDPRMRRRLQKRHKDPSS